MTDILAAYDWLRLTEQTREQLGLARAKLEGDRSDPRELGWLAEAEKLLAENADVRSELMQRALELSELAEVRNEQAADQVGPWADALEHLHAGIVFHAGLRSPLVEALFPHRKFDVLRRADLSTAQTYGEDFGRRLKSSYVDRLLGQEDFAFAKQGVDEVAARYLPLSPSPVSTLSDADRAALVSAMAEQASSAELLLKQARLLVEAALARLEGAFTELGMRSKPKTRTVKVPKATVAPVVEAPAAVEAKPAKPKRTVKIKANKPAEGSA